MEYQVSLLDHVINSYLESCLNEGDRIYEISGKPKESGVCPCCNYLSIGLGSDGWWDICSVCFWENGGDGPNHMSLSEAQENFNKIGAMDERSLKFVDPDGSKKYAKNLTSQPSTPLSEYS